VTPEARPFHDLAALEAGLQPRLDRARSPAGEPELLAELQRAYRMIKADQSRQPEIYQPAGEWREHVALRMPHYAAFYDSSCERLSALLGNFWRNELGVLVKQYAGYPQLQADGAARERYAQLMAYDLMIWTHLLNADVSELAMPEVGHPWGYLWQQTLIGSKAMRYHVLATQLQDMTREIARPVVAELGAGYGGLAYYLMRGNEARVYVDFDLPETLMVAAYYLRSALPHRRVYLHHGGAVDWNRLLGDYDVMLVPNWLIGALPVDSVDAFVNTFSLSEMTYPVIGHYVRCITAATRHYFLHNNMDRAGVLNQGHERIPASRYPVPELEFKLLYKRYDLFQQKHYGRDGDYREYLYQKS
jgi:putative sugar O-methyltransferase